MEYRVQRHLFYKTDGHRFIYTTTSEAMPAKEALELVDKIKAEHNNHQCYRILTPQGTTIDAQHVA